MVENSEIQPEENQFVSSEETEDVIELSDIAVGTTQEDEEIIELTEEVVDEAMGAVSSAAGEATNLRGYPASTGAWIAALCERAGPGTGAAGDITAVYSVLVAGSDMEEPIADILRGVLDGHIVLDRAIAERGRFPAVDVVRSVSRSLPDVATPHENGLIAAARRHLGVYARSELMIQSGLYVPGSDKVVDEAIACHTSLDSFCTEAAPHGPKAAFCALQRALSPKSEGKRDATSAGDHRVRS